MSKAILIVVDDPHSWPLEIEGVELVAARDYITDPYYLKLRRVKIFNLCRSYRYQNLGYYVSLLAAARGHRVLPGIGALQDLKSPSIIRFVSEELDVLIQKSFKQLRSESFTLSIYLGHNLAMCHAQLSLRLFKMFQMPFLRAVFVFNQKNEKWQLQNVQPIAASEIPEEHRSFAVAMVQEYFTGVRARTRTKNAGRFDLAILVNPEESDSPSNSRALKKFLCAAESVGFVPELIGREDFGRLPQFDALFLRETTRVNHHTYKFARRAAAEGLVVVDDPDSILKCTNKVFLAELLNRHKITVPKSLIAHRGNQEQVLDSIGLPCILKQPDSSFSQGVLKVDNGRQFKEELHKLLQKSDLVIAQEFMPTAFDWRIGIFDRKLLYACKYYMASRHWQILKRTANGKQVEGLAETFPVEEVPLAVCRTALKAANLIGNGFYGVDLKQVGKKIYVIEINDNPSIDAGVEDRILKDNLYLEIMQIIMERVEVKKGRKQ
ncbi:MAG: RimK family protein [Desulfuromonadales bacterium]|nr:RimK family protein [Desulfuromonadales bacterium]